MLKMDKQKIFATPESFEDLHAWINKHLPEDRVHLHTAVGMYHNLIAKAVTAQFDAVLAEEDALCRVYTDLLMLQDGSWVPDNSSIENTISNLESMAEVLGIELQDKRG